LESQKEISDEGFFAAREHRRINRKSTNKVKVSSCPTRFLVTLANQKLADFRYAASSHHPAVEPA
jgi:hypothetical protein